MTAGDGAVQPRTSARAHLPSVERQDGTLEEGGKGVGERSRSDLPPLNGTSSRKRIWVC